MNFYCKKLTQVEVGYGLLNVAQYVSLLFLVYMVAGSNMVAFILKTKLIPLFY